MLNIIFLSTLTMSKGVGLTRDDKMILSHSSGISITSFCFCVYISEKSGHSVKMNVPLQGKDMSHYQITSDSGPTCTKSTS